MAKHINLEFYCLARNGEKRLNNKIIPVLVLVCFTRFTQFSPRCLEVIFVKVLHTRYLPSPCQGDDKCIRSVVKK